MKIAQFQTEQAAIDKRDYYNSLASDDPDFNLVDINKHPDLNIWWFNYSACVDNGGFNKNIIEQDEINLDVFEVNSYWDLISMGYLPQPEPPNYNANS